MTRNKNVNRSISAAVCCLLLFESAVLGAGQATGLPSARPTDAGSHEDPEDRARRLADYRAWREHRYRNPPSAFTFKALSAIFADDREVERFIESYTIAQELSARLRDSSTRLAQEAEIEDLWADVAEVRRAHAELAAEYERLRREATARGGAGLFGMLSSLAVNIVFSAVPGAGPVLGPAVASGYIEAINGGTFGEVLLAMGVGAGASFAAQKVFGALNGADAPATGKPGESSRILAEAGASVTGFTIAQGGAAIGRISAPASARRFTPPAVTVTGPAHFGRGSRLLQRTLLAPGVARALQAPPTVITGAGTAYDARNARQNAVPGGARPVGTQQSLADRMWAERALRGGSRPVLTGDSLLRIPRRRPEDRTARSSAGSSPGPDRTRPSPARAGRARGRGRQPLGPPGGGDPCLREAHGRLRGTRGGDREAGRWVFRHRRQLRSRYRRVRSRGAASRGCVGWSVRHGSQRRRRRRSVDRGRFQCRRHLRV